MELPQRFWDKVDKDAPGGCWLWMGAKQINKHKKQGRITMGGKQYLTHKISLEAHLGRKLAEGIITRHKCKSDLCVNPEHLEEGTQAENNQDKIRDGTSARGEKHHRVKLTQEQVLAIRSITGKTQQQIADEYSVDSSTISYILSRKSWYWL